MIFNDIKYQEIMKMLCTILFWRNVCTILPWGHCGLRYWPEGIWCTMLHWGNVVYDIALRKVWCTISFPGTFVFVFKCVNLFININETTILLFSIGKSISLAGLIFHIKICVLKLIVFTL